MKEYQQFVEFSFDPWEMRYTAHFLDGSIRSVKIEDLPHKISKLKHHWEQAELSADRSMLLVQKKKSGKISEIPAYLFFARGKEPNFSIVGVSNVPMLKL